MVNVLNKVNANVKKDIKENTVKKSIVNLIVELMEYAWIINVYV